MLDRSPTNINCTYYNQYYESMPQSDEARLMRNSDI